MKALSSEGIIVNDTHAQIMKLHEEGRTLNQIARYMGISERTVECYLPRVRGVYGESQTRNAKYLREWKKRKKIEEG